MPERNGKVRMAKGNQKCVRMTDEVLQYVDKYDGKGFNEKFENLVLFALKEEKAKKERLKDLDAEIEQRWKKLKLLSDKANQLDRNLYQALNLEKSLQELKERFVDIAKY